MEFRFNTKLGDKEKNNLSFGLENDTQEKLLQTTRVTLKQAHMHKDDGMLAILIVIHHSLLTLILHLLPYTSSKIAGGEMMRALKRGTD